MDLEPFIRNIPDWPKPGVQFKDITTLLLEPEAFRHVIDDWKRRYSPHGIDKIAGAESRGFIFGSALAYAMNLPFVPIRKPGKLPGETIREEYELEYGTDALEMHVDAIRPGEKVLLIDDLLATGGTMEAAAKLIEHVGAQVVEMAFVIELPPLKGREKLRGYPVYALIEFMVD